MELTSAQTAVTLGDDQVATVLAWMVAVILGSGVLVLIFRVVLEGTPTRRQQNQSDASPDTTLIRSWLAIALVSGLLVFGVLSFTLDAGELRNLLMGGIIASAGTATAFYFASKESENTQRNLLNAAFGTPTMRMPNLVGISIGNSRQVAQALGLMLEPDPTTAADDDLVTETRPTAGTSVKQGEKVTAVAAPRTPANADDTVAPKPPPKPADKPADKPANKPADGVEEAGAGVVAPAAVVQPADEGSKVGTVTEGGAAPPNAADEPRGEVDQAAAKGTAEPKVEGGSVNDAVVTDPTEDKGDEQKA
ncbi:PASTA domain-containing protein [Actinoplanes sp. LDG1-06]|uniref:PASTA domain-containing protein n=1 Tax=Paractinoplanes ovalisporus TaxID=2810368 RepID=A0ABS2AM03_9ACTN|nr:PASTA domain-containing protein [Actinoplanes ovalisporus]MBM2620892.1 PASTA domain-containing protein [Actinoplanes ovalisporus]